jgi:hypothetical protein
MRSEILFYSSSHIEHQKRNNFILKIFLRRFLYHRMRSDLPAPPFSQTLIELDKAIWYCEGWHSLANLYELDKAIDIVEYFISLQDPGGLFL